ncbi:MAG TPA: RHS repeat-associated core domain-containing protein [Polyangiaceae bacterium LLY-WYZ-15_(1-7)]|nr:RHS repeat-associated core domain-containing protein [Polyangiaceae bacterium LLY-WYZ-15_(1-7)]HJL31387.1 RHS repeat-associated core domain-containing protein [Polyangiaceae bacterium LLY-WYZ-15_(1-7)]HJL47283.1 RHS repeat-associated core domain-containing protein [Polyangiaceae bacterium LLY-WYZ-15_(1-7)]
MTQSAVRLCTVRHDDASLRPDPAQVFQRLVHLALLKLDFISRGPEARDRGAPLIDVTPFTRADEGVDSSSDAADNDEEGRQYWAGGFGEEERLERFLEGRFWQLRWSRADETRGAQQAWSRFDQIQEGNWFAIEGLAGRHELAVHLVGEVTGIEPDLGRIELAPIPDAPLYRGPAPRGSGVGDWLSPLVSVTRPDVIELLFGESESEDATGDDRAPDALSWTGPLNQILYGPPGTGKTYRLRADLFPKFTRTSGSTEIDEEVLSDLSWFQVVAAACGRPLSTRTRDPWSKSGAGRVEGRAFQSTSVRARCTDRGRANGSKPPRPCSPRWRRLSLRLSSRSRNRSEEWSTKAGMWTSEVTPMGRRALPLLLLLATALGACRDGESDSPDGSVADAGPMDPEICDNGVDDDGDGDVDCADIDCAAPTAYAEDDRTLPPQLFAETVDWLWTEGRGACPPLQRDVAEGALVEARVSVLRGRLLDEDGRALAGAEVTVLGKPELGYTLTRGDGGYDLAVNGGQPLTVVIDAEGHVPIQRTARRVPIGRFAWMGDAAVVPLAEPVRVEMGAAMEAARGPVEEDEDGRRQLTVLFPGGASAEAVMPGGATMPLPSFQLRPTEVTVGDLGPERMPAELPPASAFTYAFELAVDEAIAMGAEDVRFDRGIPIHVDNFLDFPVGTPAPLGYYDRQRGVWTAEPDGIVLAIVGETGAMADIDLDGDGMPDGAEALGALDITSEERAKLAELYEPGQELWRVVVRHFSTYDINWAFGFPSDSVEPLVENEGGAGGSGGSGTDNPSCAAGSVIRVESQVLGEHVPVPGTALRLHYQSDRQPGFLPSRTIAYRVTPDEVPESLERVEVVLEIAGHRVEESLDPEPDQRFHYIWDGVDAYGQRHWGSQRYTLSIGYVYPANYASPGERPREEGSFGEAGTRRLEGNFTRDEVVVWLRVEGTVRYDDARVWGLGGFTLDAHHVHDSTGGVVLYGDGEQRSTEGTGLVVDRVGGAGSESDPGVPATEFRFGSVNGVAVDPEGRVYVSDAVGHRIWRIERDGTIHAHAGTGTAGDSGDGGPALDAQLNRPGPLAVGPDGSVYFTSAENDRVRRIRPDGLIGTVAGNGREGHDGIGGPAIDASLVNPGAIAVNADGIVFFVDGATRTRLNAVSTDGRLRHLNADARARATDDGTPLPEADLGLIGTLAIGTDGALYLGSRIGGAGVIFRIGADRRIRRVAGGNGLPVDELDEGNGGPARAAKLSEPTALAFATDGSIWFAEGPRVRRVDAAGVVDHVAGGIADWPSGNGGPAADAVFVFVNQLAFTPGGQLLIADGNPGNQVRRVRTPFGGFAIIDHPIPSADGRRIDVFDGRGWHLETVDAYLGELLTRFDYDDRGQLASLRDPDDNVVEIRRPDEGHVVLVAPYGEETHLFDEDGDGYAERVEYEGDPARAASSWSFDGEGRLRAMTDRTGVMHTYEYDGEGRLVEDTLVGVGSQTLSRNVGDDGYEITLTSAEARSRAYGLAIRGDDVVRSTRDTAGNVVSWSEGADWGTETTYPDGSVLQSELWPDPVFGAASPFLRRRIMTTPGGRQVELAAEVDAEASVGDPEAPILLSRTERLTLAPGTPRAGTFTRSWDASTRTWTMTSPEGRQQEVVLDERGRVVELRRPGLHPATFGYDDRGRVDRIVLGVMGNLRETTFRYDTPAGERWTPTRVEPADARHLAVGHDPLDRVTSLADPAGETGMAYDDPARTVTLTPPESGGHALAYDERGALTSYTPPTLEGRATTSRWDRDADGAVDLVRFADGRSVDVEFDGSGRVDTIAVAAGVVDFTYATDGLVDTVHMPNAAGEVSVDLDFDGRLPVRSTWTGAVSGSVELDYDARLQIASVQVAGAAPVTYDWDLDGMLSRADVMDVTPDAELGYPRDTRAGRVDVGTRLDGFGELERITASWPGGSFEEQVVDRDAVGRIVGVVERDGGVVTRLEYGYDAAGRLDTVLRNGSLVADYDYDANGNRTAFVDDHGSGSATYDVQDRIDSHGDLRFDQNDHGQRTERVDTVSGETTRYRYDELGNLERVQLPGGTTLTYAADAMGRRVARFVDGAFDRGWLYVDALNPIAELAADGSVRAVFVYGTKPHVPDLMLAGGRTYRFVVDHLGSVRRVVDVDSGDVAQALDYDAFGRVLRDTRPGFQPFGFAGGLWDADAGLVRFGARDYDPELGRWTARDPILFAGGQPNLYQYAGSDPVNRIDPSGHLGMLATFLIGGATGAVIGLVTSCDPMRGLIVGFATGAAVGLGVGAFGGLFTLGSGALRVASAAAGRAAGGYLGGVSGNLVGQIVANGNSGSRPNDIDADAVTRAGVSGAIGGTLLGPVTSRLQRVGSGVSGNAPGSAGAELDEALIGAALNLFPGLQIRQGLQASREPSSNGSNCGCN